MVTNFKHRDLKLKINDKKGVLYLDYPKYNIKDVLITKVLTDFVLTEEDNKFINKCVEEIGYRIIYKPEIIEK